MYSKSNGSNNRNYTKRSDTSNRRPFREQQTMDNGIQNFQNTLAQLNQINQMMLENKRGNPIELMNKFFNNPPK